MPTNKGAMQSYWRSLIAEKPTHYTSWSVANLIVIGTLLSGVIITFYFVYQNVYSLYNNAATIIVLNSELTIDVVNFDSYNNIRQIIDLKNTPVEIPKNPRDIFNFGPVTSTPKIPLYATSTSQT